MRIEPIGDKVVVKQMEADEVTAGGIVLPDSARQKPQQGRVLSVGQGRLLEDGSRATPQVSDGDQVVYDGFGGSKVEVDGETLLILNEHEILAVLE